MNRQSNIELLRGVLMLMVVFVHLTGNGVLKASSPIPYTETNWIIANLIDAVCYPAVNCFILISGYFCMKPTFLKFLKLEIPVIMYQLILVFAVGGTSWGVIISFIPVVSKSYWFLTGYAILMLLAPILNNAVETMSLRDFRRILILPVGGINLVHT